MTKNPKMDEKSLNIIREIAQEEGITFKEAYDAVKSEFDCVRATIREGKKRAIKLPKFGTFWCNGDRLQNMLDNKKKRENGESKK